MNKKQHHKLLSYHATLAALEALPGVGDIAGLPAELAAFRTRMGEVLRLAQVQREAVAGKRLRRDELLREMADAAVDVAQLVSAYAHKQKLVELSALVRVDPPDFSRMRRSARPVLAKTILDAAHAVLPELAPYGVTAAMLHDLEARMVAALEGIHQPRTGIVERKTATGRLATLFDEIDVLLEEQIDRLVYRIRKTHPTAYASYRSAREIMHHTGGRRRSGATSLPVSPPLVMVSAAPAGSIAA